MAQAPKSACLAAVRSGPPYCCANSASCCEICLQVIRRPKVEYQSTRDSFELTISTTEDVDSLKKKAEAHHGLPADSHTLLWNGEQLSASKSLASYGFGSGSVLELVPIEPLEPGEVPEGSPLLSSPQHGLVRFCSPIFSAMKDSNAALKMTAGSTECCMHAWTGYSACAVGAFSLTGHCYAPFMLLALSSHHPCYCCCCSMSAG